MRIIFSSTDNTLTIARGIDATSIAYFRNHLSNHPFQALVLVSDPSDHPVKDFPHSETTSNHQAFIGTSLSGESDAAVIRAIRGMFPSYNEDSDPVSEIKSPDRYVGTDVARGVDRSAYMDARSVGRAYMPTSEEVTIRKIYKVSDHIKKGIPHEKLVGDCKKALLQELLSAESSDFWNISSTDGFGEEIITVELRLIRKK